MRDDPAVDVVIKVGTEFLVESQPRYPLVI